MDDESYYGRTVEAHAIHAVVDGDDEELRRVLSGLLRGERRELARQARTLADACDEMNEELE
jgi:hypothetical protein